MVLDFTVGDEDLWHNFRGFHSPTSTCRCRAVTRRERLRKLICLLLLMAGLPLFATTAEEFYENLYKRGLAHFQNGSYETAIRELRLAAFGLIEVPERFAMAQAYVVAAAERLNRTDEARVAMQKIVAAPMDNKDVRIAAAEALGRYRDVGAARTLINVLNGRDFGVAWQARHSLVRITGTDRDEQALEPFAGDTAARAAEIIIDDDHISHPRTSARPLKAYGRRRLSGLLTGLVCGRLSDVDVGGPCQVVGCDLIHRSGSPRQRRRIRRVAA